LETVPIYHPSYYLGLEKDSGIETYYYFDDNEEFKLIGGMHFAHDVSSFFEIDLWKKYSAKDLTNEKG